MRVATDEQGRMRSDALREAIAAGEGPTIVCAQAGEVNTGSFDSFEEIAAAAVFLASEASRFITGVTIPVDGGVQAFGGV